jgi:hypothetical protein
MDTSVQFKTMLVNDRIGRLEFEAVGERLAATARRCDAGPPNGGLRRSVGRLLISAGRRVAGEPGSSGSAAARPAGSPAH